MKFSEAAATESKYLKADDLKGRTVPVVIESYQTEVVGKGDDARERVILYFQGKEKGMVCNVTNGGRLTDMLGDEMDDWIGREITLRVERVPFQGKMVPGLRIGPPPARQQRNPTENGNTQVVTERAGYRTSEIKQGERPEPPSDDIPF